MYGKMIRLNDELERYFSCVWVMVATMSCSCFSV